MSRIEIVPITYGNTVLSESMIFRNGDPEKTRPIPFKIFLLKTDERLILVDAGCVTMPDFEMENFIGPIRALEKLGIQPGNITDVVITHAHHDHIECVSCFENATVHIQRDEYADGKRYFMDGMTVRLFDESAAICEGVRVVKIGGHSRGSCIVEVIDGEDMFILAGDECYMRECLERRIPTGCSYCYENSRAFIEKYSRDYNVLLCHDD